MIHRLPDLPYELVALEPHVDTRTLQLHHSRHHAAYVDELNAVVERFPVLAGRPAAWLLLNPGDVPPSARETVRASAGGHVNHSLFWRAMTARGGGEPDGQLALAIRRDFGSFAALRQEFDEAGARHVGSGWVWLVRVRQNGGRLRVVTTRDNANPMLEGHFPLLVNDLWEHAYYLGHHDRRAEYLAGWWPAVDWAEVARRFARSDYTVRERWSETGDLLLLDAA